MTVIYKYELQPYTGPQDVRLPVGAELLSFGSQGYELVIWAKVQKEAAKAPVTVQLLFTGQECHGVGRFVGTTTTPDGLVWHLFE